MGSTEAKAYLGSPEVVAASALSGKLSGTGVYKQEDGYDGVDFGFGDGMKEEDRMLTAEQAMDKVINQLDSMLASAEQEFGEETEAVPEDRDAKVDILPGFPEKISGEVRLLALVTSKLTRQQIVFLDADNINTDGIYPGSMTYQDNVSKEDM